MAVCLVTGGAGFIGSHLVDALVARGDQVRVLDNLSTGFLANLDDCRSRIEFITGDLDDPDVLHRAVHGTDVVFHLACPQQPDSDASGTVNAKSAAATDTLHLLTAARAAGVRRLVYASSCEVYGRLDGSIIKEDNTPSPTSSYGFAKFAAEMQCLRFALLHGLETVRLRCAHAFGPRQNPANPYARELLTIVQDLLANRRPDLGDFARTPRDLIYVDDVVHATVLAAETPRVSAQAYNITRGRSTNLLEIVRIVNELLGTKLEPMYQDTDDTGAAATTFDSRKAETELGFCSSIDLRQGLNLLIEHLACQQGAPASDAKQGPHFRDVRRSPTSPGASNDSDPPLP